MLCVIPASTSFGEIHGRYIGIPGHYERSDELPDCSLLPDRKYQIRVDCYCDHLTHMQRDDDRISPESHSGKAYGYGQMKCHI